MIAQTRVRSKEILHSNSHPGQEAFWFTVGAGKWEPETLDVLERYVTYDKVFIDIGAWNGILSLYASKLGARVEAVECDPKAIEMASENMRINHANVFLSTCAISDKEGTAILESHNGDWGNSMSTIVDRKEQKGQYEVFTHTLQSFVEMRGIEMNDVCLIKIDTEGAECLIIPSSLEFLMKYKPTILLSLHSFWFPEREKSIIDITNVIFSIYKVMPVYAYNEPKRSKEYTPDTFTKEMYEYRCFDVLLLPK